MEYCVVLFMCLMPVMCTVYNYCITRNIRAPLNLVKLAMYHLLLTYLEANNLEGVWHYVCAVTKSMCTQC